MDWPYKQNGCEMVWIKIDNGKINIKVGVIYMPQESRTKLDILKDIYAEIEKEIKDAAENGFSLLILGDLNCKVGDVIKGNTKELTKGGRLLLKMVERNKMTIVNAADTCEGLWTRIEEQQQSVIDYVLMFEEELGVVERMEIDEDKNMTPYYIDKADNGKRKYTDHCLISGTLDITLTEDKQPKYVKIIGNEGWKRFREKIREEKISDLIMDDRSIQQSYEEWNSRVLEIKDKCSKKVKKKKEMESK